MRIDPLSDISVAVTGSANFSGPRTTTNDENMVVIRDDLAVTGIYFGEYIAFTPTMPSARR